MANLKLRSTTSATDPGSTSAKGSALTHSEMDSNFILLQADIDGKISSASPTLTGNTTIDDTLRFNDADDTNYVAVKAPDTVGTNYTLKLPTADGSNGQVLTTDGSGNLSFTSKTALTSLDIDSFTDGTGITVAATDKLLISDATTEKKINASQILDYVETGITMTGDLTSTAGATALGATTMSGQLNLASQEITGDDTLTAPDLANASDITSISQNGTMLRVNASDNDTSNTTQAGLFFDQGSGRMNFQLVQDLTGAHSGHSSVGGSGIIHPSLSFQTRDDGGSSTRATMDLMAPYQGDTGDTLTSSGGATGKICDVNTSKRTVFLQNVSGTWTVGHTTSGAPVAGTISGVVSIGTNAVAVQYQSSGFTTDFNSLTKATLGKVRISTKDVMNGRGQNSAPQLDIEASQINMQNVRIDDADGLFVGGPDYADIITTRRNSTSKGNYSIEVAHDHTSTALAAGGAGGAFGFAAYSDNAGSLSSVYPGFINGILGDGGSLASGGAGPSNNAIQLSTYDDGGVSSADTTLVAEFRGASTKLMDSKLALSESSNNITFTTTSNGNLVLAPNGTGEVRIDTDVVEQHSTKGIIVHDGGQGTYLDLTGAGGANVGALYGAGFHAEETNGAPQLSLFSHKTNGATAYPNLWAHRSRDDGAGNKDFLDNGDIVFSFFGAAWDGTTGSANGEGTFRKTAAVEMKAAENHTASAGGGKIEFYTNENGSISYAGVKRMTIDEDVEMHKNVVLHNQSGDPSTVTDASHIYAKDDSGSSEVYVRDEAGNVTKISPHNDQGEWEYFSRNINTGKTVRINMEQMIRDIEQLTGNTYIENE